MKKDFEASLYEQMKINKKIVLFLADSVFDLYEEFEREFPGRFFNFGIAESNMVAAAGGLAKASGKGDGELIPVVYTMTPFLIYRAYEFIRNDICMQKLNVKLVGVCSGVKNNNLGPTHHATEDIAVMRVLPDLTILSPVSPKEVSTAFLKSLEHNGPVYIRLGKAFETEIYDDAPQFEIGKSTLIQSGNDITIISTGNIITCALEAAARLRNEGITADVINMSTIKPIDAEGIIRSARKTGRVVSVEEHQIIGGLGSAVSEVLCENNIHTSFERIGFKDTFCTEYGWHKDLLEFYGMSPDSIFNVCKNILNK
ncbi:MAG: transketolase family protein [Spirochaetaceae bacterium]|nr:transketolase family protein [Spirochaetaceae bacterium]